MRDDGTAAEIEAPRRRIIKRPRLTRLLDEADARILLLVAPAGYGKTTLAREWIAGGERRAVWMVATPAVADLASFALAMRRVLSPVLPAFGMGLEEHLRLGPRPSTDPSTLGEHLGSQLSSWDPNLFLVIDDYHQLIGTAGLESFIDVLLQRCDARVLIASRVRPSWATPRRIVYGEIRELGQQALAMTQDEAVAILSTRSPKTVPGLVALADGWPALLGLAARIRLPEVPSQAIADSFYDFLADELYNGATELTKEGLVLLSLAPTISDGAATALLGRERGKQILEDAVRLGFIQKDAATGYSMHSLIGDFLSRRCSDEQQTSEAITRLGKFFLECNALDDLYVLARRLPTFPAIRTLVNVVIGRILEHNEIEALDRWLDHASEARLDTPEVDLAAAERLFRGGHYEQSELLAARSATRLPAGSPLRSRALFRAGLSAYHDNRSDAAARYHRDAWDTAVNEGDRLQALWGQLTVALELERDSSELIGELERRAPDSPAHQIRLANARLARAYRVGGLAEALEAADASLALLRRVGDPMVVTAFLNGYGLALLLTAHYERALTALDQELTIVQDFGLKFAVPHALIPKAAALAGRRQFAQAQRTLREATETANETGDEFSLGNIIVQRARLMLLQGDAKAAAEFSSSVTVPSVLGSMTGEFLSTRAMALAAVGKVDDASDLVKASRRSTNSVETREWANWTDVLIAEHTEPTAFPQMASDAFDRSCSSGCLHSLVCAFRCRPKLLMTLSEVESLRGHLEELILRSRDESLGRAVGLQVKAALGGKLSPRETEVFQLLGEGLSNRDIAQRLFISEVTVKVHVRRIFEKLGVRSRTEAALLATNHFSPPGR
jgi:ATP/maltotriose-dependent transcriptional regulator MalT